VIAVGVLLLGGIGLIAINATRDARPDLAAGGQSSSAAEEPTPPSSGPESAPPSEEDGPAAFGETFIYEDGLSISVGPPNEFTPSETAVFDPAPSYVKMTITITNDSDASFDTSWFLSSAQSGQHEASEVFDSTQGLEGPPYTSLLSGRSVSWDVGFGVDDPEDVVLEITPSLDHEDAVFISE